MKQSIAQKCSRSTYKSCDKAQTDIRQRLYLQNAHFHNKRRIVEYEVLKKVDKHFLNHRIF